MQRAQRTWSSVVGSVIVGLCITVVVCVICIRIRSSFRPTDVSSTPPEHVAALPNTALSPASRVLRALSATNGLAVALRHTPAAAGATPETSRSRYLDGMSALTSLPAHLDGAQIEMLRDLLALPLQPDCGLSPLAFNGLKHAAADLLVRQNTMSAALVCDFASMAEDETYDEIWRDYCLQMLAACHERLMEQGNLDNSEARQATLDAMRRATFSRLHTWAGTALLGLDAASRLEPAAVAPTEVISRSIAIASDAQYSEAARITALRIAALHHAPEVRSIACELAQTDSSELLCAAAIATLGEVGGDAEKELLRTLVTGTSPFLANVANRALDKLFTAQYNEKDAFCRFNVKRFPLDAIRQEQE